MRANYEQSTFGLLTTNLPATIKSLGLHLHDAAEKRQIAGAVDGETSTFLVGTAIAGAIFIGYYMLLAVIAATRRFVVSRNPYPASRDAHLTAALYSALDNFRY
ncbi:uncharacterized protein LOC123516597 isoform X1 [Portunus trituberculatus]|uniref:uncharacterized protein LOC123516597 isoform X1 n=1 Tax=Portunus trituberculatus TaxID=210409 RepID=UPI001E1D1496|nr:uncharacterized protein LOC123516597 isoform X1 [Portunus trituberculatus]